jgi:hypothetical protein
MIWRALLKARLQRWSQLRKRKTSPRVLCRLVRVKAEEIRDLRKDESDQFVTGKPTLYAVDDHTGELLVWPRLSLGAPFELYTD